MNDNDPIKLTIDDILEDLKNATKPQEEEIVGYTAEEISEMLGVGKKKVAKQLKKMVQSGKLRCSKKQIIDVAGRNNFTYIYHPPTKDR